MSQKLTAMIVGTPWAWSKQCPHSTQGMPAAFSVSAIAETKAFE